MSDIRIVTADVSDKSGKVKTHSIRVSERSSEVISEFELAMMFMLNIHQRKLKLASQISFDYES